jgi:hypothetical protein
MLLEDDERFLIEHGWTWYIEALRFHRNRLTDEEQQGPDREGIQRAKVDYYRYAISKLAEHERGK